MSSIDASINQPPQHRILIVAAEASSALYAQRLLEHWKANNISVEAFGVGSVEMEALGFERLGCSEEMGVVGFFEVLKHYNAIAQVFKRVCAAAQERKPQVVLLMDYPGFNLRLASKLKPLGIPIVYYISPQVWAWKTGRVKTIREVVDKMLVLFSFEKVFYDQHNVASEFVGHPLLDELNPDYFSAEKTSEQRALFGFKEGDFVLGLMPGSRQSEIKYHLDVQLQTAKILVKKHKNLKVSLLVAPTFSVEEAKSWLPQNLDFSVTLVKDEPMSMVQICDFVLCASGTATLFVGLLEKPMIVMYRMNSLTAWLAKRIVTSTPFFGMINLILGKEVAPEFFQEQASPDNLSSQIDRLIVNDEAREEMVNELKKTKASLGNRGATQRVAQALSRYFNTSKSTE